MLEQNIKWLICLCALWGHYLYLAHIFRSWNMFVTLYGKDTDDIQRKEIASVLISKMEEDQERLLKTIITLIVLTILLLPSAKIIQAVVCILATLFLFGLYLLRERELSKAEKNGYQKLSAVSQDLVNAFNIVYIKKMK